MIYEACDVSACTKPTLKARNRDRSGLQATSMCTDTDPMCRCVPRAPERGSWHRPMCTVPDETSELTLKLSVFLPASTTSTGDGGGGTCASKGSLSNQGPPQAQGEALEGSRRGCTGLGDNRHECLRAAAGCCGLLPSAALHAPNTVLNAQGILATLRFTLQSVPFPKYLQDM